MEGRARKGDGDDGLRLGDGLRRVDLHGAVLDRGDRPGGVGGRRVAARRPRRRPGPAGDAGGDPGAALRPGRTRRRTVPAGPRGTGRRPCREAVTTMTPRRWAIVVAAAATLAGLLAVGGWTSTQGWNGPGPAPAGVGMMSGAPGMMAGRYGLPGDGRRVGNLAAARVRADAFAARLGLHAGEVLQFSNGFY